MTTCTVIMQTIRIVQPKSSDKCADASSVYSAVQLTLTLSASAGNEVVNRFATSFPVGKLSNGSVSSDESSIGLSGSFFTDNGLELIPRERVPTCVQHISMLVLNYQSMCLSNIV